MVQWLFHQTRPSVGAIVAGALNNGPFHQKALRAATYQSWWPLRGPIRYDAAQAVFNGRPATSRPAPVATLVRKASGHSIKANGHFVKANGRFIKADGRFIIGGALAVFKARLGSRT